MVTSINSAYHWNITRIAEAFDMDRGTVRRKLRAAHVKPASYSNHVALYALSEAVPALYRRDYPNDLAPDEMEPHARRAWYQSENERTRLEDEERHLVPAPEAIHAKAAIARVCLEGLNQLPEELAPHLDAEALARVHRNLTGIREQLTSAIAEAEA